MRKSMLAGSAGALVASLAFTSACGVPDLSDPSRGLPADAASASAGTGGTSRPVPSATNPPPSSTGTPITPAPGASAALPPIFANPVQTASAAPIAGGTLLVTADGKTAVAADPDRNAVFLVDLTTQAVRSIATQPGEELGRVLEGPNGSVFVAARRGGAVLAIDVASGTLQNRFPVCNAPRGMAYDSGQNRLYVACRSGRVATLDAATGAVIATLDLDEDLRDVFLVQGLLVVTRFRSAEVLMLDTTGKVNARLSPGVNAASEAGVAYRALALPNGNVLVAHEFESSAALGTGSNAQYGGGCAGGGVVSQALTLFGFAPSSTQGSSTTTSAPAATTAGYSTSSAIVGGALGPLDLAVSRDGTRFALIASGNSWSVQSDLPTLFLDSFDVSGNTPPGDFQNGDCSPNQYMHHAPGEPVAVAFDGSGKYVVQSREPAMLELEGDVFITLSTESHFDTGFAMFHLNANGGIACVSCHPEGGDDGHVWSFNQLGLRRSKALEGDVGERAPFHWSGDLPTFQDLFSEVMMKRMQLPVTPPDADVQALEDWLDTIPALAPADGLDPALVDHGRSLFFDATIGCSGCHSGSMYSDHAIHDVGTGGGFVTPALIGVGLRAPVMHDGCATTLRDRFGVCGGTNHGNTAQLTETDIDALVAFLRSL
jgi:hypothetical protein